MSGNDTINIFNTVVSPFTYRIEDATQSNSPTEGALIVAGGVGVGGNIYTGGIIRTTSLEQATGVSTGAMVSDGGLSVAKDAFIIGTLDVGGNPIESVGTPINGTDAATKDYVDSVGTYTAGDGIDISGNEISVDSTVLRDSDIGVEVQTQDDTLEAISGADLSASGTNLHVGTGGVGSITIDGPSTNDLVLKTEDSVAGVIQSQVDIVIQVDSNDNQITEKFQVRQDGTSSTTGTPMMIITEGTPDSSTSEAVFYSETDATSSTNAGFKTLGGIACGKKLYTGDDLDVTGDIIVSGTVDGRDIAADGSKLDNIEDNADVTDETNVVDALDGATLPTATVSSTDKVLIQDADDGDNLKTVTAQSIADLADGHGLTFTAPLLNTSETITLERKTNGGLVVESNELAVDLGASSITGTLAVGDGGTGATSFTEDAILKGNTTSAVQESAMIETDGYFNMWPYRFIAAGSATLGSTNANLKFTGISSASTFDEYLLFVRTRYINTSGAYYLRILFNNITSATSHVSYESDSSGNVTTRSIGGIGLNIGAANILASYNQIIKISGFGSTGTPRVVDIGTNINPGSSVKQLGGYFAHTGEDQITEIKFELFNSATTTTPHTSSDECQVRAVLVGSNIAGAGYPF